MCPSDWLDLTINRENNNELSLYNNKQIAFKLVKCLFKTFVILSILHFNIYRLSLRRFIEKFTKRSNGFVNIISGQDLNRISRST